SENAVHAGFSRRRAQFSLLRRLGCGAQSIRTLWGLSPLGAVIRTLRGLRVKRPSLSPNLGTAKVPSKKSKQRESCQMAPHHPQWTFLCGTLSSENPVHAGFSRRRAQFSLLRRLGCGGGGIRTHEGLSSLPVFKFDRIVSTSVHTKQSRTVVGPPPTIFRADVRPLGGQGGGQNSVR